MDPELTKAYDFLRNLKKEESPVDEDSNIFRRTINVANHFLKPSDVEAEVFDWVFNFLEQRDCPDSLGLSLAKKVARDLGETYNQDLDEPDISAQKLQAASIKNLFNLCDECPRILTMQVLPDCELRYITSMCAIKNGRKKMEDRHVLIHDLNAVCDLPEHSEPYSYYAVFDGHAGIDAASYAAAHLHKNIASHPLFLTNTEEAIKQGFLSTDKELEDRARRENIKSGCTVLCAILKPEFLYLAWLGDSQAMIVEQGIPKIIMSPHKPDRSDEKQRIEELGGSVLFHGTWRVNGILAVSRALGDIEHKPYVSNQPDVMTIPLEGSEDFLVLACDGIWDKLTMQDVASSVLKHLVEEPDHPEKVASRLVKQAKDQGSKDNITIIVIFLKDPELIASSYDQESLIPLPQFHKCINIGMIFPDRDKPPADSSESYKSLILSLEDEELLKSDNHIAGTGMFDQFVKETTNEQSIANNPFNLASPTSESEKLLNDQQPEKLEKLDACGDILEEDELSTSGPGVGQLVSDLAVEIVNKTIESAVSRVYQFEKPVNGGTEGHEGDLEESPNEEVEPISLGQDSYDNAANYYNFAETQYPTMIAQEPLIPDNFSMEGPKDPFGGANPFSDPPTYDEANPFKDNNPFEDSQSNVVASSNPFDGFFPPQPNKIGGSSNDTINFKTGLLAETLASQNIFSVQVEEKEAARSLVEIKEYSLYSINETPEPVSIQSPQAEERPQVEIISLEPDKVDLQVSSGEVETPTQIPIEEQPAIPQSVLPEADNFKEEFIPVETKAVRLGDLAIKADDIENTIETVNIVEDNIQDCILSKNIIETIKVEEEADNQEVLVEDSKIPQPKSIPPENSFETVNQEFPIEEDLIISKPNSIPSATTQEEESSEQSQGLIKLEDQKEEALPDLTNATEVTNESNTEQDISNICEDNLSFANLSVHSEDLLEDNMNASGDIFDTPLKGDFNTFEASTNFDQLETPVIEPLPHLRDPNFDQETNTMEEVKKALTAPGILQGHSLVPLDIESGLLMSSEQSYTPFEESTSAESMPSEIVEYYDKSIEAADNFATSLSSHHQSASKPPPSEDISFPSLLENKLEQPSLSPTNLLESILNAPVLNDAAGENKEQVRPDTLPLSALNSQDAAEEGVGISTSVIIPEGVPEAEGVTEDSDSEKDGGWSYIKGDNVEKKVKADVTKENSKPGLQEKKGTATRPAAKVAASNKTLKKTPFTKAPSTESKSTTRPSALAAKAAAEKPGLANKSKPVGSAAAAKTSTRPASSTLKPSLGARKPLDTTAKPPSAISRPPPAFSTIKRAPTTTSSKPPATANAVSKARLTTASAAKDTTTTKKEVLKSSATMPRPPPSSTAPNLHKYTSATLKPLVPLAQRSSAPKSPLANSTMRPKPTASATLKKVEPPAKIAPKTATTIARTRPPGTRPPVSAPPARSKLLTTNTTAPRSASSMTKPPPPKTLSRDLSKKPPLSSQSRANSAASSKQPGYLAKSNAPKPVPKKAKPEAAKPPPSTEEEVKLPTSEEEETKPLPPITNGSVENESPLLLASSPQ